MKNLSKILSLLVVYLFFFFSSYSQNPADQKKRANRWVFGDYIASTLGSTGLDFTNGIPVAANIKGIIGSNEGPASICDINGKYLFHTNLVIVYNANKDTLLNGEVLLTGESCTQGALMVPIPENDSLIYIFTVDEYQNAGIRGLRYSLVNMNLDNGLGGIITTQKNILIRAPSTEQLAAVHHCNGKDVWVITSEQFGNKYYAYLVTNKGIDTNAITTAIGLVRQSNPPATIKFSPNGKKMISLLDYPLNNPPQLFDFDNATGIISNPISLIEDTGQYGASFSPDNSKLYIGAHDWPAKLIQYDVSSNDSTTIINSRTIIHLDYEYSITLLNNGPDGKIYVSGRYDTLAVISNPNEKGLSCNFIDKAVPLDSGITKTGLANFIESYFSTDSFAFSVHAGFVYIQDKFTVEFKDTSHNANTYYWDFGDGTTDTTKNPVHTYDDIGTYYVCLYAGTTCGNDTFCQYIQVSNIGLSEKEKQMTITIYPNPFNNYTDLFLKEKIKSESVTIKIYDCVGKEVKRHVIGRNQNSPQSLIRIYRGNLQHGIYFIEIDLKDEVYYYNKIIITD